MSRSQRAGSSESRRVTAIARASLGEIVRANHAENVRREAAACHATPTMLIVGLGNPGPSYRSHRHNIGFMVLERLHSMSGASEWRDKYSALHAKGIVAGQPVTLLQPQTFMNLSGTSVQKAATDLRFPPAKILVVHDELELPFGEMRAKFGGGHAGHNGLRDITAKLGADFGRVRVGIGRPTSGPVDAYVLSGFAKSEVAELPAVIDRAVELIELALREGIDVAVERSNPPVRGAKKKS